MHANTHCVRAHARKSKKVASVPFAQRTLCRALARASTYTRGQWSSWQAFARCIPSLFAALVFPKISRCATSRSASLPPPPFRQASGRAHYSSLVCSLPIFGRSSCPRFSTFAMLLRLWWRQRRWRRRRRPRRRQR